MIRSSKIATASLAALLASSFAVAGAAAAAAAADYYLKLGDIKGESTDKGHKVRPAIRELGIQFWSWGATNPATAKVSMQDLHVASDAAVPDPNSQGLAVSDPGASGPKTTSKRQHKPMTVTQRLDKASPKLMEALAAAQGSLTIAGRLPGCTVGTHYADALLHGPMFRYELKDMVITSCAASGSGGGGGSGAPLPVESVSFNYSAIRELPAK